MRTSVIIPAYNAAQYLHQAIEGVRGQVLADWELVIVDDGSEDETAQIAAEHAAADSRIRVVSQPNGGLAGARNRGFAAISDVAEFVIFLDADDVWEQETLQLLVRALDARPQAVAASGLQRMIDSSGQPCSPGECEVWGRRRQGVVGSRLVPWPLAAPTTLAVLSFRNCIGTSGLTLARRAALEAVGPFDPLASPCEDWDMWIRLSRWGDIAFIDRVLLGYRWHGANMSSDAGRLAPGQDYVRRKLVADRTLSEEEARIVRMANWHWARGVARQRMRYAGRSLRCGRLGPAAQLIMQSIRACLEGASGRPVH